jgi:carbon starvation protein CstA
MLAKYVGSDISYANQLTAIVILVTMGVIFTLVVYQFWQHNELRKIQFVSMHMSNLFGRIRRIKSRREANIQRYLLLTFMIGTIIMGAIVAYLGLQQVVYSH